MIAENLSIKREDFQSKIGQIIKNIILEVKLFEMDRSFTDKSEYKFSSY